jgi:hypothetical protein
MNTKTPDGSRARVKVVGDYYLVGSQGAKPIKVDREYYDRLDRLSKSAYLNQLVEDGTATPSDGSTFRRAQAYQNALQEFISKLEE